MATKKKTEDTQNAALATTSDDSAALAELYDMSFDVDGLGPVEGDDVRFASLVLNMRGTDEHGDPIPKNRYYNTLRETQKKEVRAVFLVRQKERRFSYFDNTKDETVHVCASPDRVTGVPRMDYGELKEGQERKCETCPYAQWRTTTEGKREQSCFDVQSVIGFDLDEQDWFVMRFKKTSMGPFKTHLQKHHLSALKVPGKPPRNVPLFAIEARLTAKMSDNQMYAIPELEKVRVLERDEVQRFAELAKQAREFMSEAFEATEKKEQYAEDTATAVNPDDFADDFADEPASAGAAQ